MKARTENHGAPVHWVGEFGEKVARMGELVAFLRAGVVNHDREAAGSRAAWSAGTHLEKFVLAASPRRQYSRIYGTTGLQPAAVEISPAENLYVCYLDT